MKTIFDLQTGVVTLLCTAALAGLTACEADPVMQESGKLPDKGSIEEVHVMLCSSNSVENRVDVLLTEGGVMTKNFYLRQTQPAAAGYSLDAWCDASLLNDYDAGDEIERTLLPEANYEFPDGKTLDLSAATQRSELKRIKFSASGLAAGEYVLPLTVAAQDAPDADKTLYYNVSVRQPYTDEYTLHDGHDLFFVFYVNTNDFQPLLVLDYIMQKKLARGSTVAWHEAVGNIVNLRTVQVGYDAATSRALLNLGSDMTYVLSQSTKYIRPSPPRCRSKSPSRRCSSPSNSHLRISWSLLRPCNSPEPYAASTAHGSIWRHLSMCFPELSTSVSTTRSSAAIRSSTESCV